MHLIVGPARKMYQVKSGAFELVRLKFEHSFLEKKKKITKTYSNYVVNQRSSSFLLTFQGLLSMTLTHSSSSMPLIKEMTMNLAARLVLVNSIVMDLVIPKDDWFPPMVFTQCLAFFLIVAYSFGMHEKMGMVWDCDEVVMRKRAIGFL